MGLREAIIDGVTGRLFAANATDDEVADGLQAWIEGPHDMQACAERARAEFSPTVMIEGYRAIWERREQRLHVGALRDSGENGGRVSSSDTAGMAVLREHLERQRVWRAALAVPAALDLAEGANRKLALEVLFDGFRTSPAQFFRPRSLRQLARTGARLATARRA
jgi:hypothetical protein